MGNDIWSIVDSMGSILSGLSFASAFILYNKTKRDEYIVSVRNSLIDVNDFLSTINSFMLKEEVYNSINSYLSLNYIQLAIKKFSEYIADNLNTNTEKAYAYWKEEISAQLEHVSAINYVTSEKLDAINNSIDRLLIHELSKIEIFVSLIKKYKSLTSTLNSNISNVLISDETAIKGICETLCTNKTILLDFDATKQRIIKSYIDYISLSIKVEQTILSQLEKFINIIAREFSGLSDKKLLKLSKTKIKKEFFDSQNLADDLDGLLKCMPSFAIRQEANNKLQQLIGEIKASQPNDR